MTSPASETKPAAKRRIFPVPPDDPNEARYFPVRYATLTERMMAAGVDMTISSLALIGPLESCARLMGPQAESEALQRRMSEIASLGPEGLTPEMNAELIASVTKLALYQSPWAILSTLVVFGATFWCWRKWNATPGKVLFRQRIVDGKTGAPPSARAYLIRLLGYIPAVAPAGAGLFWIAVDSKRRGWHDLMAGTVVLRINDKELLKHVA